MQNGAVSPPPRPGVAPRKLHVRMVFNAENAKWRNPGTNPCGVVTVQSYGKGLFRELEIENWKLGILEEILVDFFELKAANHRNIADYKVESKQIRRICTAIFNYPFSIFNFQLGVSPQMPVYLRAEQLREKNVFYLQRM